MTGSVMQQQGVSGKTVVSAKQLIQYRYAAERLSLSIKKIRSHRIGQYYSPFKGRGMEFDESRLYLPGDDVRNLDWRVTARTGKTHTKLFREERERSVIIWTDFQASMHFATRGKFKSVVAANTAALLAWSSLHKGDRLGYLVFNENMHIEQRPQGGKWNVLNFMKVLADASANPVTNLRDPGNAAQQAMMRLRRVNRPGSKIVLVSDFKFMDDQLASQLSALSKHNDMVMLFVYDPLEMELPASGVLRFNKGNRYVNLDTDNKKIRADYQQRFAQHMDKLKGVCQRYRIHFLPCRTDDDIITVLSRGI